MNNVICLDPAHSTTRSVTEKVPELQRQPFEEFKFRLILPKTETRQGEGGLRIQGYFKANLEDEPLITVFTVVFNGEQFLEATILSVLDQTYDNVEYIIVDGGSTDGTLDIIRKYEHCIDYWVSEKDNGIYDAFNKAVCLSSGAYYLVLGSDDILFPGAIEKLINSDYRIKKIEVDFVVSAIYLGEKFSSGMHPNLTWLGAQSMVTGHSVGMLIKPQIHSSLGLYSMKYKLASDALFIKHLFASKFMGIESNVIMGRFAIEGASNNNIALGLCEGFLVQYETEKFKLLQVLFFIARLLKNIRNLR